MLSAAAQRPAIAAPARAPSAICMISHSRQLAGGTSDRERCRVGGLARPVEQVHVLLGPDVAVRSDRFRVAYRRVPSPPGSRIRVSASRRRRSCNRGSCRGVGHPSHRPTRTTIIRGDDPRCAPEPRAKSCSNKLQQSRRRMRSPHVGFRVEPADADAWRAPIRPFASRGVPPLTRIAPVRSYRFEGVPGNVHLQHQGHMGLDRPT